MKLVYCIMGILLISCQPRQEQLKEKPDSGKPSIILNKRNFSISTQPDSLYLNFVQFTLEKQKKTFVFKLAGQKKNRIELYDSLKGKLSNISFRLLDTLHYNLKIELQSSHIYGYNLDYGYIHPKMNIEEIQLLKPLVK